jgi:hypothetical protein
MKALLARDLIILISQVASTDLYMGAICWHVSLVATEGMFGTIMLGIHTRLVIEPVAKGDKLPCCKALIAGETPVNGIFPQSGQHAHLYHWQLISAHCIPGRMANHLCWRSMASW